MRRTVIGGLGLLGGVFGCAAEPAGKGGGGGAPAGDTGEPLPEDTGPPPCGSAGGALPAGLETLSTGRESAVATVRDIDFRTGGEDLNDTLLHEAVRFDLPRPARIHGYSVWFGHLPAGAPTDEVAVALWPDFGHNGFDFQPWAPLAEGTRCLGELSTDGWVDYALPAPVEVALPGLVYVGHTREGFDGPAFAFDTATVNADGSCAAWSDCSSALNLPLADDNTYYNGTSFPLQYSFLVRLHLEWTASPDPGAQVFAKTAVLDVDADGDGALDPLVLGGRAAWADYDGDGWEDVLTGGTLLRNLGGGVFHDATAESGVALAPARSGGVWGDMDNDGDPDLLVFAESLSATETLLRNEGDGTFVDVSAAAGLVDVNDTDDCGDAAANVYRPTAAAAWWDIDGDGFLDLTMANFICWSSGSTYADTVFRGRGDGTFEDWTGSRGFSTMERAGRALGPADADGDGDVDLLVGNYRLHANFFYDNAGDGTVVEAGREAGLRGTESMQGTARYYGHTIGVSWGDLDNDGDLDVVTGNLAHPRFFDFSDKTQVLLNDGDGTFIDRQGDWTDHAGDAGLRYQETHSVPALADFDHDGVLDLALSAVYPGRPSELYWGRGDGTFTWEAMNAGLAETNGWGMATADHDNDGDVDLAASVALWDNERGGDGWVQVRVVGAEGCNRMGLGATVRVEAGGRSFVRVVSGGNGQGGQDSAVLHVGLGGESTVDAVAVRCPGQAEVVVEGPFAAGQRWWVGTDGRAEAGWAPPDWARGPAR